jgi:conjugative transfer signal peptidase TraF
MKGKHRTITRAAAIGCIGVLVSLGLALGAGLRINGSHSFPIGLYWAIRKPPQKGDMVFADPPPEPIFALAKARGYLGAGYGPAGCEPLIKRISAATGDHVTINAQGVEVNGVRLANSRPCVSDAAGRPLQPHFLKDYVLGRDEVLLMSEYSAASFDSRYFGPLSATTIESVITPILTWR